MYCSNCGQPNPEGSRFCEQCGSPIEIVSPPISAESIPSTPKWMILSLAGSGLAMLGFFLSWVNPGGYMVNPAEDIRYSGLTFIWWTLRTMQQNQFFNVIDIIRGTSIPHWGALILIPLLISIGLLAVKITLLNISLFRKPHTLPVEVGTIAPKIKIFSIFGLICLGIYFLNVIWGFGKMFGVLGIGVRANLLDFGFWLTLIGFALSLTSVTKIRRQKP